MRHNRTLSSRVERDARARGPDTGRPGGRRWRSWWRPASRSAARPAAARRPGPAEHDHRQGRRGRYLGAHRSLRARRVHGQPSGSADGPAGPAERRRTAGAVNGLASTPVGGVAAVTLEDARAADGAPIARVRLLLTGPSSARGPQRSQPIQVDVAPDGAAADGARTRRCRRGGPGAPGRDAAGRDHHRLGRRRRSDAQRQRPADASVDRADQGRNPTVSSSTSPASQPAWRPRADRQGADPARACGDSTARIPW